jgi:hypothetical protein
VSAPGYYSAGSGDIEIFATIGATPDCRFCLLKRLTDDDIVVVRIAQGEPMIDGLKLIMPGTELRNRVTARIQWHESRVAHFERELKRTAGDETEDILPVPEHILELKRDDHLDQVEILTLIREHVIPEEVYRLDEGDLRFAGLLPETECW